MKKCLLDILSEVLNKFVNILFFKKIVVLKAAYCSNPVWHFKHLQRSSFWGNFLEECYCWVATSGIGRNISCVIYILNMLFIDVLTDSFILFTNILFKMLEFNPLCYKKKPYMWRYNLIFFFPKFFSFGGALRMELLYERSQPHSVSSCQKSYTFKYFAKRKTPVVESFFSKSSGSLLQNYQGYFFGNLPKVSKTLVVLVDDKRSTIHA